MSFSSTGFLRKLIFLETFSTPLEFLSEAKIALDEGDLGLFHAIENSSSMEFLRPVSSPSQLVCESETRYARLYSSPVSSRERLLVAFTGAAMRMMMPLPVFMQALPRNTDLLILYDPQNNHYRSGIWDGTSSIADFSATFNRLFGVYKDVISLGTSIGGLPAIRFAKHAGIRRGISVGGQTIDDTLRILRREKIASAYDPLCECDSVTETEAICIYAAGNVKDALAARRASVASNFHDLGVPGLSNHGFLWDVAKTDQLSYFMEMFFSASAPEIEDAFCLWAQTHIFSRPGE